MRTRATKALRAVRRATGAPSSSVALATLLATPALLAGEPALAGAVAGRSAGRTVSIVCRGGGNSCSAVVSVAGGASNRKLRIALSDTDLKLVGVLAKPTSIRGAYILSRGSYSLGGSVYTVTLNAVQSIPKGATLTLRFAVPTTRRG
jgi:hypothetical protein